MLAIDFFERGVARFPSRTLVSSPDGSVTYAEMAALARRMAGRLIAGGVGKGDRVAILSPNHPMVLAGQYAAMMAGGVCAPLNFRNAAGETAAQLRAQDARWLFVHSSMAECLPLVRREVATLRGIVCLDGALPDCPSLAEWIAGADEHPALPEGRPEDPVYIMTSSGSTGTPKLVVHTNRSFEAAIANTWATLPFDAPPRHLVVAPLSHAAGILHWTLLALGGEQVLLPSTDAGAILRSIEGERIDVVFLPPTLIYLALAHPDVRAFDYSTLRHIIYGAAPMSIARLREALDVFGPVLTQFYGQSEALLGATVLTARDHLAMLSDPAAAARIASAGRPSPLADVRIMGEDGALLPPGQRGEIVVRGGILMSHYLGNPEATAAAGAFGWHHTGDIGFKDEEDYVYIVDRKADMIITGAFNVFPAEVEQVVMEHPAVQNCAVVGAPDEKWGECVLAAVEAKQGAAVDASELLTFCRARLSGIKAPKRIEIWPAIPRNAAGKTMRREVRSHYWQGHDRTI